jgi:hypothetical protein
MRGLKPRLGQLSSETTRASRFTRQMAEPRVSSRIRGRGGVSDVPASLTYPGGSAAASDALAADRAA